MSDYAFISYAQTDAGVALAVAQAFEQRSVQYWLAYRDLQPGQNFAREVAERIAGARAFVAIVSHAYSAASFSEREWSEAESRRVPMFVLRIDRAPLPSMGNKIPFDAPGQPSDDQIAQFVEMILAQVPELRRGGEPALEAAALDVATMERLAERNRRQSEWETLSDILKQSFGAATSRPIPPIVAELSDDRLSDVLARLRDRPSAPAPSPQPPDKFGQQGLLKLAAWGGLLAAVIGVAFTYKHELSHGLFWLLNPLKFGAAPPPPAAAPDKLDEVDVSAFAPVRARRGSSFFVQAFVHRAGTQAKAAAALAVEADPEARRRAVATLDIEIGEGERLDFVLEGEGVVIDEPHQSLIWRGKPRGCSFLVRAPADFRPDSANLRLRVLHDSAPVGRVGFAVGVDDMEAVAPMEIMGSAAQRYRRAFLSFASPDRAEVLKRAQVLGAAKLDYFQDLLSLEPGEDFEKRIFEEIRRADVFLLFWSDAAKASKWVMREIDCALESAKSTGRPVEIVPVILGRPPPPAPPDALKHLHFNDKICYLIAAIEQLRAERPAN